MKEPTDMGLNRTGIGTSPIDSKDLLEGAKECQPTSLGDETEIARVRVEYGAESSVVGTMPPPSSVRGAVLTMVESITKNPMVFLDKLGERLAFERTGVRLFDALIAKYDVLGSWEGGPTRELLAEFREDELRHFHVLKSAMESLGADPTALTPSGDLAGVEGMGLVQVITDPRTTLPQALHAQLIAELTDGEGWDMLVELAETLGHDAMADDFRDAMRAEEKHLAHVRQWVAGFASMSAQDEIEKAA
ncbi:ferritin-like domain-containing protein [Polyangium aurulentum]|uniref:ferritin-like domain-containing protein n=1 Tax=Polyangium aurulentum TaxID=2567896 RepID=UPI0010ADB5AB|nr:ferritin-like domain-containing protein [Polyangium aurulentum]UQA58289.1 ferritin-like domain-containing protein [Polyangium aurulentum]